MKKNKIFVNKIDKKINNNQKWFNINNDSEVHLDSDYKDDKLTVDEKLAKLFNCNGYIFNINVKIVTKKKTYQTRIAGKVNNHLVTIDNEIIYINDIEDIIILD